MKEALPMTERRQSAREVSAGQSSFSSSKSGGERLFVSASLLVLEQAEFAGRTSVLSIAY